MIVMPCPDHGAVEWERVAGTLAIGTKGVCPWVVTEYDWRKYREAAHLSRPTEGYVRVEFITGLALIHRVSVSPSAESPPPSP